MAWQLPGRDPPAWGRRRGITQSNENSSLVSVTSVISNAVNAQTASFSATTIVHSFLSLKLLLSPLITKKSLSLMLNLSL
ncbi:hypothetical protein ACLOJK_034900 [Asimina triloba]